MVPIEISGAFYKNLHEAVSANIQSVADQKQALINIEKAKKDPSFKLSLTEYNLLVFMNLVFEIENVAKSDPDKYIEVVSHEVKD